MEDFAQKELEAIKAFHQAVRQAQIGDAPFPVGHQYAGKTKAEVRELILAGTFVPAPEFIPGLDGAPAVPAVNTAPLPKKSAVAVKVDEKPVE